MAIPGSHANPVAAMTSGAVDAAMLGTTTVLAARAAGFRELLSFVNTDLVEPQGSIIAREEMLESNHPLLEKFIRGTVKGLILRSRESGWNPAGYCANHEDHRRDREAVLRTDAACFDA